MRTSHSRHSITCRTRTARQPVLPPAPGLVPLDASGTWFEVPVTGDLIEVLSAFELAALRAYMEGDVATLHRLALGFVQPLAPLFIRTDE